MYLKPLIFFAPLAFLVVTDARCPTGAVQGTAPDDCYALVSATSGWYDAEETCVERGGHLASVTSGFVNAFVRQQANDRRWESDYWLGGSNDQGTWTWTDGVPFKYQAWAKGQPSTGDSLCLLAKSISGQWSASSCFALNPFVCKLPAIAEQQCPKPTPTPSSNCPPCQTTPPAAPQTTRSPVPTCNDNWMYSSVTNKCYWVIDADRRNTWGQEVCDTVSAKVVSIHSPVENEVALTVLCEPSKARRPPRCMDRSPSTAGTDSERQWTDGTPVEYVRWSRVDDEYDVDDLPRDSPFCALLVNKDWASHKEWIAMKCDHANQTAICKREP